jgi:hypothetical protein
VGTCDSALDSMAWPGLRRAAADRDLAHVVLGCQAGATARPMQHSWEALGSRFGSLAKGHGAHVGI